MLIVETIARMMGSEPNWNTTEQASSKGCHLLRGARGGRYRNQNARRLRKLPFGKQRTTSLAVQCE